MFLWVLSTSAPLPCLCSWQPLLRLEPLRVAGPALAELAGSVCVCVRESTGL